MRPVNDRDLDYATRTLLAEAGNQGLLGMSAVAHVIKNRLENGRFGDSISEVITKPYQFEPWLHAGKGTGNDPLRYSPESPQYRAASEIFRNVLTGEIPDPTRGATHFYAPVAQRQLAQLDNRKVVPDWATPESRTATIGGHEFYNVGPKKMITVTRPAKQAGEGEYELPDYMREAAQEYGWEGHQKPTQKPAPYSMPDYMQDAAKEYKWPNAPLEVKKPEELMAPQWGAGRSFATGLTLGAYPYIEAGVETLGDYGEGQDFSGKFSQNLANVEKEREAYRQQAAVPNALAEGAGTLVPTLLGGMGAVKGLTAAGRFALQNAPAYLRPAMQTVGRFVSGEAGEGMKGIGGAATRAASNALQGGLYGTGQGLATHYVQPNESWEESAGKGALGGAIGSVLFNPWLRTAGHAINPEITPAARRMAQDVNRQFPELNLRPGQVAKNAASKELDKAVIPAELNEAQQTLGNDIIKQKVGLVGQDLADTTVAQRMDDVGTMLENIAARTAPIADSPRLQNAIQAARRLVYNKTRTANPSRKLIDEVVTEIYQEFVNYGGRLPGTKFRDLISKNGLIHNELLGNGNSPIEKEAGYKLKEALLNAFQATTPQDAAAYANARLQYRTLLAIKPLTNPSGVIDMTKLLKQVAKQRLTGDVQTLAKAGRYMTPLTPGGGVRTTAGKKIPDWAKFALGGAAVGGAEHGFPFVQQTLEGLGVSPFGLAGSAAAVGGARYLSNALLEKALSNPTIGRNVLNQTPLIPMMKVPVTSLAPATGSNLATEVGFEKRRKK